MTDVLNLEMRRRLFSLIQQYPGLHVREAARQLETSLALVEYHLEILGRHQLVEMVADGNQRRLFATNAVSAVDREALAVMRDRYRLSIVLWLLDMEGPASHKGLAASLGFPKSTLSFHLRKLEAKGIVEKTAEGLFQLCDPKRVQALLLANRPTPDMKSEFASVWQRLYGDG